MINANELRIGNWVDGGVNGSLYYRIKASDFANTDFTKTKPVALTEDILIKCGFEKLYSGWFKKSYFTDCNEAAEKMEIQYNVKSGRCAIYDTHLNGSPAMTGKSIEYIHQLQNLYYALTGEELNIELNAPVSDTTKA
jgi:hypothetical protein